MSIKQKLINLLDDTFLTKEGDEVRIGMSETDYSDFIQSIYLIDNNGNMCCPSYIIFNDTSRYYIIVFKNYLIPEEFNFSHASFACGETNSSDEITNINIPSSISNEVDYYVTWEPQDTQVETGQG